MATTLVSSTIRFSQYAHQLVQREAAAEGMTVAGYVREAAVTRAAFQAGARWARSKRHERLAPLLRSLADELGQERLDRILDALAEAIEAEADDGSRVAIT